MSKFLFDLFPVIVFFVAFKFFGIYVATGVAIIATFLQVGYLMARKRKVEPMLWVSLIIIVLFGGATLMLHDETFIKWKPTILYWCFSAALVGAAVFFKKNLIRALMGAQVELPDEAWSKLLWSWVAFFAFMGVANIAVAYSVSTDAWVNFKLFGGIGLMLLFVLAQGLFLAKYVQEK
jgi:intracellular septation protein